MRRVVVAAVAVVLATIIAGCREPEPEPEPVIGCSSCDWWPIARAGVDRLDPPGLPVDWSCSRELTCTLSETPGVLVVDVAKPTPTPTPTAARTAVSAPPEGAVCVDDGECVVPATLAPGTTWTADLVADSVRFEGESITEIGTLSWPDGKFHFEGDADASARVFFDGALRPLVDEYIRAGCEGRP